MPDGLSQVGGPTPPIQTLPPGERDPNPSTFPLCDQDDLSELFYILKVAYSYAISGNCDPMAPPSPAAMHGVICGDEPPGPDTELQRVAECGDSLADSRGTVFIPLGEDSETTRMHLGPPARPANLWVFYYANTFVRMRGTG